MSRSRLKLEGPELVPAGQGPSTSPISQQLAQTVLDRCGWLAPFGEIARRHRGLIFASFFLSFVLSSWLGYFTFVDAKRPACERLITKSLPEFSVGLYLYPTYRRSVPVHTSYIRTLYSTLSVRLH